MIAYGAVGNYFYNYALNANNKKTFLEGNPHLQEIVAVSTEVAEEEDLNDDVFKAEHIPSELTIVSKDKLNLKLHADFYENGESTHKWAIVTHGYSGEASHMTRWIRNFYEQGYHVLAPDLRGHGSSEDSTLYWNTLWRFVDNYIK